jgi:hypothetical protein
MSDLKRERLFKTGCRTSGFEEPPGRLLWLLALNPGEIEFPRADLFPPADRQPPEECFQAQHLLILSLISFNRIGQKPYHKPRPTDLHRFLTSC